MALKTLKYSPLCSDSVVSPSFSLISLVHCSLSLYHLSLSSLSLEGSLLSLVFYWFEVALMEEVLGARGLDLNNLGEWEWDGNHAIHLLPTASAVIPTLHLAQTEVPSKLAVRK